MKNRLNIKRILLLAASVCVVACSDWTDPQSIEIKHTDIKDKNPELYAQYLSSLRAYKNSDHKIVMGWVDNIEVPFSRGYHLTDMPDSIDIIALINPDNLPQWILAEKQEIREKKGTRCVYTISYAAIEKAWQELPQQASAQEEGEPEEPATFADFVADYMDSALALCAKYDYDGFVVDYPGRSMIAMTEAEKNNYLAAQQALLGKVQEWMMANVEKLVLLQGSPQYVVDTDFLDDCDYLILPTLDAPTLEAVAKTYALACVEGVPTDRFLTAVHMTSLNAADVETGWYGTQRALIQAAWWSVSPTASYTKAGLAVYNLQNDYFNVAKNFPHSREAIYIMNPSPKN